MACRGITFLIILFVSFSTFAEEATSDSSSKQHAEGEENTEEDKDKKDKDEEIASSVEGLLNAAANTTEEGSIDSLSTAKEELENRIATLKEEIEKADPADKTKLEEKLAKLTQLAEKLGKFIADRTTRDLDRVAAKANAAKEKTPVTAEAAPTEKPGTGTGTAASTHQKPPTTEEPRGNTIANNIQRNAPQKSSPKNSPAAAPAGKSFVPERSQPKVTSAAPAANPTSPAAETIKPAIAQPAEPTIVVNNPPPTTVQAPAPAPVRAPASISSPIVVDNPKISEPKSQEEIQQRDPVIARREAAPVTSSPSSPQARLANNAVASVDSISDFNSRAFRKSDLGSTKDLYQKVAIGTFNPEPARSSQSDNTFERPAKSYGTATPKSFYGSVSSSKAQGQYIELGIRGVAATTSVAGEIEAIQKEKELNPAKVIRVALKPIPPYNSPTVKDPINQKRKDTIAEAKKSDFAAFRENPFL